MAGVSDTLINTLFDGRYRILRKLGSGGMANVYLAEDEDLGRRVAIKILNERYAEDDLFIERFRREAKSAAGLSHPNIVSIYDRGEAEGTYYIAMEVIEGRSLKELILTRGALPIGTAISYSKQLLEAVGFAHRHGIIHRDIKPHNVLVSADQQAKANEPRLKVTDFGIARQSASQMTEAGSIMGTAQYLSPEQARGAPVTAASDLYSAGIVLYEMLTGKVPFTGDSAIEIAMKHVNDAPAPPSSLRPEIPFELDQIVLRALAKDPGDRYQTAEEFIEDLEREEAGLPLSRATAAVATALLAGSATGEATELLSEGPTRVVTTPPPPPSTPRRPPDYPPASPYDEPPKRRRRWVPWLLVALLIAAAGLAGWWAYNQIQEQLEESAPVGVPLVEGIEVDRAIDVIEEAGLEAEVEREPSTRIRRGHRHRAEPQGGHTGRAREHGDDHGVERAEAGRVPGLVGLTYDEAVDALNDVGLDAQRVEVFSQRPPGEVVNQNPKEGQRVDEGTEVEVRVSQGVRQVQVPDVLGQIRVERAGRARDCRLRSLGHAGAERHDSGGPGLRAEPEPRRRGRRRLDRPDHDLDGARARRRPERARTASRRRAGADPKRRAAAECRLPGRHRPAPGRRRHRPGPGRWLAGTIGLDGDHHRRPLRRPLEFATSRNYA